MLASLPVSLGLALTISSGNASTSQSQRPDEWDKILDECHIPGAFSLEPEYRIVPYQQHHREALAENGERVVSIEEESDRKGNMPT